MSEARAQVRAGALPCNPRCPDSSTDHPQILCDSWPLPAPSARRESSGHWTRIGTTVALVALTAQAVAAITAFVACPAVRRVLSAGHVVHFGKVHLVPGCRSRELRAHFAGNFSLTGCTSLALAALHAAPTCASVAGLRPEMHGQLNCFTNFRNRRGAAQCSNNRNHGRQIL